MTNVQKVIKYLAIAFAMFLIFNIVYVIIFGISSISELFFDSEKDNNFNDLYELEIEDITKISNMDIELDYANLVIQVGDTFKIEVNQDFVLGRQKGNVLYIEEEEHSIFSQKNKNSEVIITVPADFVFNELEIETGAGKIEIEKVSTDKLSFDFGAGKAEIEEINVYKNADLDGGAGEIKILSGEIYNLDLDMGIGKVFLESRLLGKNQIDAGVGEIEFNILGEASEYTVKTNKGIGTIVVDGNKIVNNSTIGNGSNFIDIDGGVGSIEINFNN